MTTDAAVLDLIAVRTGEALSIGAVRASIAHIYSLGRFQDVQVEAAEAPGGGVALRFNLIPIHSVQRIEFTGTLGLSAGQLRSTVVDRYGASPSIGRVDAAVRTLQQLYADHGYLRAKVEAASEVQHDPDRAQLTFTIDAGPRAVIGQVAIERDPLISREAFLRQLGAEPGATYLRPRIQERLDTYVQRLKDRRYYEAEGLAATGRVGGWPDRRPRHRHHVRAAGDGALRFPGRRAAARRSAQGTGAARARRVGRRGPARGFRDADRELPASAGLLEGGCHGPARGHGDGADDRVRGDARAPVSRRGADRDHRRAGRAGGGAGRARRAQAGRALPRVHARRRRGRDSGALPAARLRRGRGPVGGQRDRSAARRRGRGAESGPGLRAGDDRHRRGLAFGARRDPDHGHGGRRGGRAAPSREDGARRRLLRAAHRRGARRAGARIPQPRVCLRQRRRRAERERRPHPRRLDVHRPGRAAEHRRPHPHRRQRAHQARRHPARAAVQARPADRPAGSVREPAPAERARTLPAGADHRDPARHGQRARRARDRRGSAGDVDRLRRRCGGVHDPARWPRRAGGGSAGVRPARLLRYRPPESLRGEPVGEPLHARQPAPERARQFRRRRGQRLRVHRVSRASARIASRAGLAPTTSSSTRWSSRACARRSTSRARASTSTWCAG